MLWNWTLRHFNLKIVKETTYRGVDTPIIVARGSLEFGDTVPGGVIIVGDVTCQDAFKVLSWATTHQDCWGRGADKQTNEYDYFFCWLWRNKKCCSRFSPKIPSLRLRHPLYPLTTNTSTCTENMHNVGRALFIYKGLFDIKGKIVWHLTDNE